MHSPPRPQPYPVAIVDLCDSDSDDSVVLLSPTKKARTYGESDAAATTARHESSDNAGTGRSASRWRDSKGKAPAYSSSSSSLGDANRTVADAGSSSDDKGVEGSVMDVVTIEDEPETVRAADPIRSAETGGNDRPDGSGGTKRNVVSKSPDVGRKSPALADAIQENEGEGNRTGASGNTETQNATNFLRDTLTSQLTCPICFDLLLLPHTITPCGHTYCGPCIFDWIQRSPSTGPAPPRKHRQKNRGTCPQCREGISGTPTPQVAMKALVEAVIPKLGLSDQEIKERAEREEAFKAHKRDANASTSGATGTRRTGPMDRFLPRIGHAGERGEAARVAVEMNRPVPLLEAMEPLGLGVIPPPPPQPHLHQPLTGLDFAYPMVGFDYGHMGIQNRAPNGPLFMPPQPVVSGPPAALPAQGTVEFWLANLLAAGRNGHEEEDDEEAVYSVEHASHYSITPACLVRSGTLPARILAAPEVWVGGWTRLSDADRRELEAAWRGGLPPGLVLVG
ncbi:hypothetical protein DFJ73DRAFT_758990 [Zopfochytrium polystomum]|nr:hypothetical protein DFJ73DRAFT_758990 [Zopfochytrium polystomum]